MNQTMGKQLKSSHVRHKKRLINLLCGALVALLLVFVLFPLLWVISTAFKTRAETFASTPTFIPQTPVLENFISIWETRNFLTYYRNSIFVSVSTTVICLALANLAAYGFSRFRMRFGNSLLMFILVSQMVPGVLFVIPYFIMMGKLGLINSHIALIVAHTSFALPFTTWMLHGYYNSIPKSLDEAGLIDGCNRIQVFARIVLPLTMPGNMATLIFAFMQSWNEYLFSVSLVTVDRMYTVPVGIAMFMGEYQTQWNELMAASLLASVPIIILYLLVDKHLIGGLTAGSIRQ